MIDQSLAHGQARHLTRELRAAWNATWRSDLTRHGIESVVPSEARAKKMLERFETRLLAGRVIASSRPDPLIRVCYVVYVEAAETLVLEWLFGFVRERRHEYALDAVPYKLLILENHAIARILQRLDTLDGGAIRGELAPVVRSLWPLTAATSRLGYAQFAVPTSNGLLAGTVEGPENAPVLRAKTFMTQLSPRRVALADALWPLVSAARTVATDTQLEDVLRSHAWLKESLRPGIDRDEERWSHAPSRRGT
jgi:hypothetical protein